MRRVLVVIVALAAVSALTALTWPLRAKQRPPVLRLTSMEPAGIFDDTGEMWLVTLNISNPDNPHRRENEFHVKDAARAIEAKVTNVWVGVEGSLVCRLVPGQSHERLLLLPAGTDSCRFCLRYAGSTPIFKNHPIKGRMEWLTERLPLAIRSRLSYKFWRWVGFGPDYQPNSDWRAISVEMPLPPPSAR